MIDQSRTTDARGLYPKMFWKTQYLNYVEELKSENEVAGQESLIFYWAMLGNINH